MPPDEAILLQTLRALAKHCSQGDTVTSQKARNLALWTSTGWTKDRPVYATDDPIMAAGLGNRLPIWQPGGGLEQFRPLLEPLSITEIQDSETRVINPEHALEDPECTALYQKAITLLHDDLQRNDQRLSESLTVPWESLATCIVKKHPSLALAVRVAQGQEYECEAKAKIDAAHTTVYVSEPAMLTRESGGGTALAALFEGNARLVAQAWLTACDRAKEGIQARRIELASESVEPEDVELADNHALAELQQQIAQKHASSRGSADHHSTGMPQSTGTVPLKPEQRKQPPPVAPPRTLVDPQSLSLVNPDGQMEGRSPDAASGIAARPSGGGGLREPRSGTGGPSNRTPRRWYSDVDRENVGFELLQMLLSTDDNEIDDLRTQRGVGADAVDQLERYYELKAFAGPEPGEVTLTESEAQRALSTPDFFLVVISNLEEGADGPTTIRIVTDPLNQLRPTTRGKITLSGLREATRLVYRFAPTTDQQATDKDD